MRKKIFILHILPIELFPPILNLLKYSKLHSSFKVNVFSSYNNKGRPIFTLDFIKIFRIKYFGFFNNKLFKLFFFVWYIFSALFRLILFKPSIILYYEPHSSFPIFIYKYFFNKNVSIFIHNHELYTNNDFDSNSMKSIKFFHKFETEYLYNNAIWISQTNTFRLNIFKYENININEKSLRIFPNYPPRNWNIDRKKLYNKKIIRMVYFGALSFQNTYIKEIVSFVADFPKRVNLDIYSYNIHSDVEDFLINSSHENINFFKDGIDYYDIPEYSLNYDLGLILYKPHNVNYTYNAPNKLFEYLCCGLNVWFPLELLGCQQYINTYNCPFVKKIDFNDLNEFVLSDYFDSIKSNFNSPEYYCEKEFDSLISEFSKLV